MTKHVFLSFVAEDLAAVNLFRGQAKNGNSALEFDDYSVKAPYNSQEATYIRARIAEKIAMASVTICLIGDSTYRSSWVEWELQKSAQLGKAVLGVRLNSQRVDTVPLALLTVRAPIMGWDIHEIVRAIG